MIRHYLIKSQDFHHNYVESCIALVIFGRHWVISKKSIIISDTADVLNHDNYTRLIVETEEGEKKAEITKELCDPADDHVVRLMPVYKDYPLGGK